MQHMKDNTFYEYVLRDLLGDIPGITSRAMFGGLGIYKNNVILAIIAAEVTYDRTQAF